MPRIHPILLPGMAAYEAGRYAAAASAWREAAGTLDGDEATLATALAEVADACAAPARHDSATLLAAARDAVSGLPPTLLGIDTARLERNLATGAAGEPPPLPGARLLPAGTGKFLVLVGLLALAALALRFTPLGRFLDREVLVATLLQLREAWWSPLALLGLYATLGPLGLPVSPLMLAGGVVFGTGLGIVYNVLGGLLAGTLSFLVGRSLGRDLVVSLGGERLQRMERYLQRHGFWGLVGVRFLPLPFPVVNYGAAFAGVPLTRFLLTLAIGLTPSMAVYTYFAATLFETAREGGSLHSLWKLAGALVLLLVLSQLPVLWRGWHRRRRLAHLRAARAARR